MNWQFDPRHVIQQNDIVRNEDMNYEVKLEVILDRKEQVYEHKQ